MSKIIYKITPDVNHYRTIFPDNESLCDPDLWKPDCQSKEATLLNFCAHYNEDTKTPLGDFSSINLLGLAIRDTVANELAEVFEASGELLPFTVGNDYWYYYNVTQEIKGLLDANNSTFLVPTLKIGLQKAVFHSNKLPKHSCIFKMPEDRYEGTYILDSRSGDKDIIKNLFCAVKGHKFKGLIFEEIARFD